MKAETYAKLKKIKDSMRIDRLSMALTYICDVGYRHVISMTEDDIQFMQGNGLMTKEYVQAICHTAKDICDIVENPTEIFQFCDAIGIYETDYFTNGEHLSRRTLEEGLSKLINYVLYDEEMVMPTSSEEETKERLAEMLDIEIEDIDKLLKY